MFINRYRPMGGWGGSVILVQHNFSIIAPVEHNFEHNILVSQVTPKSIVLYFSSIIQQTLLTIDLFGSYILFSEYRSLDDTLSKEM